MTDQDTEIRKDYRPGWINDFLVALVFLTRFPLRLNLNFGMSAVGSSVRCFPLVGFIVGGIAGTVFLLALSAYLSPLVAAFLAVGAQILITGALHEDALGDVADGFGGGATKDKKLEIMRDSRVGTYAVVTLFVALGLKVAAISAFSDPIMGFIALLTAAGCSRGMVGIGMYLLPPARKDGLGATTGKPPLLSVMFALFFSVLIPIAILGPFAGSAALLAASLLPLLMGWIAYRQIGGQTGDVLGSLQQVSEIGFLLTCSALLI